MLNKIKNVVVIPARGGSKGLPKKNIRILDGKPLITHSILDAKEAKNIDATFVTTDDSEIATISQDYGAEIIKRPMEFSTDNASSEVALLHAVHEIEKKGIFPELIVFLQCTSPLRTGNDIDRAITQLRSENADSLLSVVPTHRFLWHEVEGNPQSINYNYQQRKRRQEMNPQYMENGSIYIFKPWVLKKLNNRLGGKISLFVMEEEQGHEIDSLDDFNYVEFLLNKNK